MKPDFQRLIESKRDQRIRLAALPPAQKMRMLDELRARAELQRGVRRTVSVQELENQSILGKDKKTVARKKKPKSSQAASPRRFGGRATAAGVNYECRIAAFSAAKMLCGERGSLWDIAGSEMVAIALQTDDAVDDVNIQLRSKPDARVFISAKLRSASIALSGKNQTFTATVASFIRQYHELPDHMRAVSRCVWAIPSTASRAVTHDLASGLDAHRRDAGDDSLVRFLRRRQSRERSAIMRLLAQIRKEWKTAMKRAPAESDLRRFLRLVHIEVFDFESGGRFDREAENDLRSHVLEKPAEAPKAWRRLEHFFADANQRGIRVTAKVLRQELTREGFALRASPDFAEDIQRLQTQTRRNLNRLKDHTFLRFGPAASDSVHIDRSEERVALVDAVKKGHLLLTGDPGCGKSGMLADVGETLHNEGRPIVLLLAEEVFVGSVPGSSKLPGMAHDLDDVLAHWPDGAQGFLITDALDAVRDAETQKALRRLLRDVRDGASGWTVLASVREYDLKHSQELRDAFPGEGVPSYRSHEFTGVAHFHLPVLSERQLDDLANRRADVRPFIEKARANAKSDGVHRSPFYLRLAAELLASRVTPARLADWNSPAVLLRRFWDIRVCEGADAEHRQVALQAICRQMLVSRTLMLSVKELVLTADGLNALHDLRSRGILQAPPLRYGSVVGDEQIQFAHHLLHDYAIARVVIPTTRPRFAKFAASDPLLAILYRQSFFFALEELWDGDDSRENFWSSALDLEAEPDLHAISKLLAPLLAARRVESITDLSFLQSALIATTDPKDPAHRAVGHLASGVQDAGEPILRAGAEGWCKFVRSLAERLAVDPTIEGALVQILNRLLSVRVTEDLRLLYDLNSAARLLLASYLTKPVGKGWMGAGLVAIEGTCRTFAAAPCESEASLLAMMEPARLAEFPHQDLYKLADELDHLGAQGGKVVLRLFEAAFGSEPEPGKWEERGTPILGLRFQTSDDWNMIHYLLAGYYEKQSGENAALLTELVCLAWNAVVRRRARGDRRALLATIEFRGVPCELWEDFSHIWGREFEHEEGRILTHFERLVRGWAEAADRERLEQSLSAFARRNRTSLLWNVFLEAGAAQPRSLGFLLESVLEQPVFLTHPDYVYGGAALLGALHAAGDEVRREHLERLILNLPATIKPHLNEDAASIRERAEYAQNRLLGVVEAQNIVLPDLGALRESRAKSDALRANAKRRGPQITSHTVTPEEAIAEQGVSLKEPENQAMFQMRDALKPLLGRDNLKVSEEDIERHWHVVPDTEKLLDSGKAAHPNMAADLWGHLVGACEHIVRVANWPKHNSRWQTIRRVLLKAADDPKPESHEEPDEDRWPSWGWPSPRLDAARGLPLLSFRMGGADATMTAAMRRFCGDPSYPLRFNFAERLAALERHSADLMWELIDALITRERKFAVLEMVVFALNRLSSHSDAAAMARLKTIADRAAMEADAENRIHETLLHTYLFRFLRTGDKGSEDYVSRLIEQCDTLRASKALGPQLHACRSGGWLTAGDGIKIDPKTEIIRQRTWQFFSVLLTSAQKKLAAYRTDLDALHSRGEIESDAAKDTKAKIERTMRLVDGVAMQLYFASGAQDERTNKDEHRLSEPQLRRYWTEASPLLRALANEPHPHTANQIVETLCYLLSYSPRDIFLLACESILCSSKAGLQLDSLAVPNVVKLIEKALADHRDLFQSNTGAKNECLTVLLRVLDIFVDAGWAEARRLTHRLEEINR